MKVIKLTLDGWYDKTVEISESGEFIVNDRKFKVEFDEENGKVEIQYICEYDDIKAHIKPNKLALFSNEKSMISPSEKHTAQYFSKGYLDTKYELEEDVLAILDGDYCYKCEYESNLEDGWNDNLLFKFDKPYNLVHYFNLIENAKVVYFESKDINEITYFLNLMKFAKNITKIKIVSEDFNIGIKHYEEDGVKKKDFTLTYQGECNFDFFDRVLEAFNSLYHDNMVQVDIKDENDEVVETLYTFENDMSIFFTEKSYLSYGDNITFDNVSSEAYVDSNKYEVFSGVVNTSEILCSKTTHTKKMSADTKRLIENKLYRGKLESDRRYGQCITATDLYYIIKDHPEITEVKQLHFDANCGKANGRARRYLYYKRGDKLIYTCAENNRPFEVADVKHIEGNIDIFRPIQPSVKTLLTTCGTYYIENDNQGTYLTKWIFDRYPLSFKYLDSVTLYYDYSFHRKTLVLKNNSQLQRYYNFMANELSFNEYYGLFFLNYTWRDFLDNGCKYFPKKMKITKEATINNANLMSPMDKSFYLSIYNATKIFSDISEKYTCQSYIWQVGKWNNIIEIYNLKPLHFYLIRSEDVKVEDNSSHGNHTETIYTGVRVALDENLDYVYYGFLKSTDSVLGKNTFYGASYEIVYLGYMQIELINGEWELVNTVGDIKAIVEENPIEKCTIKSYDDKATTIEKEETGETPPPTDEESVTYNLTKNDDGSIEITWNNGSDIDAKFFTIGDKKVLIPTGGN